MRLLASLVVAFSALTFVPHASAHVLLPPELVLFIQEHPDATQAEIEAFMEVNPQLGDDAPDSMQVLAQIRAENTPFWENAGNFVLLGIEHILIGLDHVLFVLAILLTFVSLRRLLKLVTAFTVAHSVTFILAGTGIVVLSPNIVEPLIAFSIAYVALTSVFLRHKPFFRSHASNVLGVFVFGLFHGLGFAGLLTEIAVPSNKFLSSLLLFNVGIEIGQLIVIAVALPFLILLRRTAWHDTAIRGIAVVIAVLALFWTVERIMGAFAS